MKMSYYDNFTSEDKIILLIIQPNYNTCFEISWQPLRDVLRSSEFLSRDVGSVSVPNNMHLWINK